MEEVFGEIVAGVICLVVLLVVLAVLRSCAPSAAAECLPGFQEMRSKSGERVCVPLGTLVYRPGERPGEK